MTPLLPWWPKMDIKKYATTVDKIIINGQILVFEVSQQPYRSPLHQNSNSTKCTPPFHHSVPFCSAIPFCSAVPFWLSVPFCRSIPFHHSFPPYSSQSKPLKRRSATCLFLCSTLYNITSAIREAFIFSSSIFFLCYFLSL